MEFVIKGLILGFSIAAPVGPIGIHFFLYQHLMSMRKSYEARLVEVSQRLAKENLAVL